MLALIAYFILLCVVMPALLLGAGKLIARYGDRLSGSRTAARRSVGAKPTYDGLHERLEAAAAANPFLPAVFSWGKRGR